MVGIGGIWVPGLVFAFLGSSLNPKPMGLGGFQGQGLQSVQLPVGYWI